MPDRDSVADPTKRFSNRVADYLRHRPGYPQAVMECLSREFGLRPEHVIADIGSGTGILTEMLLENGNRVLAVEPNDAMRRAAEEQLNRYSRFGDVSEPPASAGADARVLTRRKIENGLGKNPPFLSVAGSAEATGLPDSSVDWITVAQAFHWFDVDRARAEALRILRPGSQALAGEHPVASGGRVAIMWNDRKLDTPFLQAYEQFLLNYGTDFQKIRHEAAQTDGRLGRFFGNGRYAKRVFENEQILDEEGLRGRTLSASYMPGPDHPRRAETLSSLNELFEKHQSDGKVKLSYETRLYVGAIHARE